MELKVNQVSLPEAITFNYEDLKRELLEKTSVYETMVYTEDQIKIAKTDRANLNRLKKALNEERIRREKEYMQPFNDFKAKIAEIISIIDKPVAVIDRQIKGYEEQQREVKLGEILAIFNEKNFPDGINPNLILDEKWLNASVSMKTVQAAIDAKAEQIETELATVRKLPEFAFEAEQVYLSSLDLSKAIAEAYRLREIAEKKAAFEAARAKAKNDVIAPGTDLNETEEPGLYVTQKEWIGFQALLSVEDAQALKQFFKSRNIEYKAIK